VPVFSLEAQEGRLFSPLAFTKTYAMAAAAGLSVTLVPVLMGYLVRGRIPHEAANPLNRFLMAVYRPALELVLRFPKGTLAVAAVLLALTAVPVMRLGGEFMPPLDEGDLLYMPSALPGLSVSKAAELLQQTDRLIKTVPEVERVFGKAGRADTATDPAPLEMFETTIQFKPRGAMARRHDAGQAGRGTGPRGQGAGPDQRLGAAHPQPHRHAGHGHQEPRGHQGGRRRPGDHRPLTTQIEAAVKNVPGVSSALAERLTGGATSTSMSTGWRRALRLSVADVQAVVSTAIGGDNVGEVIQGRERYPINVRYPREIRDSLERLRQLPFVTDKGAQLLLQRRREDHRRRRPADAAQRERAAVGLGVRRRARPRPALGRQRHAGRGRARP
jgi:Cu(I)/Ag(I) efflux system membrane protein CusA/SilA